MLKTCGHQGQPGISNEVLTIHQSNVKGYDRGQVGRNCYVVGFVVFFCGCIVFFFFCLDVIFFGYVSIWFFYYYFFFLFFIFI